MIVLGLLLGLVGTDVNSGEDALHLRHRGTVPTASASSPLAMGMFGSPRSSQPRERAEARDVDHRQGRPAAADADDFKRIPPILRGTRLGSVLGILPGGGAVLASVRRLHAGKEDLEATRRSARARSKAWPVRKRPTTPARRPPSSRC
jgi:putative tricarboxylic transport membrane protein